MKVAIFVGRFQPFHNGHYEISKIGLKNYDKLIIVIGSTNSPKTIRNPFTYQERKEMIESCFSNEELKRIIFVSLKDYTYLNNLWIKSLQSIVYSVLNDFEKNNEYTLIGYKKDFTSNYLDYFPQWNFRNCDLNFKTNSTKIREYLFDNDEDIKVRYAKNLVIKYLVPNNILLFLLNWIKTEEFKQLKEEYQFIKKYKELWKDSPYPPTFVTVDAVVIQAGHILMIKRKINPGKGMYALPGGFIGQTETIKEAVIRELKEETKINLSINILEKHIEDYKVFDDPYRDFRGRTITNAFLFRLNDSKPLYKVKGADDAEEAEWLSFSDIELNEEKIYADHFHIIKYFLSNN
jgi:bifunctional NMN adenylyltransferase/nudix hydrolase